MLEEQRIEAMSRSRSILAQVDPSIIAPMAGVNDRLTGRLGHDVSFRSGLPSSSPYHGRVLQRTLANTRYQEGPA